MTRRCYIATLFCAVALAVCTGPLRGEVADDLYAVGAGHYVAQRWEFAAEEFREFLKQAPDHKKANHARFFLGESLIQLKKYREARRHYLQLLAGDSDHKYAPQARFRVGEASYLLDDLLAAEEQLAQFLDKHPQHHLAGYALPYLAETHFRRGKFHLAAEMFHQGIKQFPKGPMIDECRLGWAKSLQATGDVDAAVVLYTALAETPKSRLADDAQFRLASLAYGQNKYELAIERFTQLLEKFPASSLRERAALGHGWALFRLKRYDDVRKVLEPLVNSDKVGLDARYWLGLAEKGKQNWEEAAKILAAAAREAEQHPLSAAMFFHAGDAFHLAGRVDEAAYCYDQVLCGWPASEWAEKSLYGKVMAAETDRDPLATPAIASEFLNRFPQSRLAPSVRRSWARVLIEEQEFEAAYRVLHPLIATGRRIPAQTRYLVAIALQGKGQFDEALAELAKVIDAEDSTDVLKVDARLAQGTAYVALARYNDAIRPLERFLDAGRDEDNRSQCRALLALCYAHLKRFREAKEHYRKLEQHGAESELIRSIRHQVSEIAYIAGNFEWASTLFAQMATDKDPEIRARGLSGLAWSQYELGEYQPAATTAGAFVRDFPEHAQFAELALLQGRALEKFYRYPEALKAYQQIIEKHASSRQYCLALAGAARLHDQLGQDQQAAEKYRQIIDQHHELSGREPQLAPLDEFLYHSAWVLLELQQEEKAAERFDRIYKRYSRSRFWPDATYWLAQQAYDSRRHERAQQLIGELLQRGAEAEVLERSHFLNGSIALASGDWAEVEKRYRPLLERFPESTYRLNAEFWIAEAEFQLGKADAARARFAEVAEIGGAEKPELAAKAALRQAQILLHQEDHAAATEVGESILSRFPEFSQSYEVHYLLGRCFATAAEFDKAREHYRKVTESPAGARTETAALAQWMIGESYFHQQNYRRAVREYLKVEILYDFPLWSAASLLQAGKCYQRLGNSKEAKKSFTQVVRRYPRPPFVEEAKRLLDAETATR